MRRVCQLRDRYCGLRSRLLRPPRSLAAPRRYCERNKLPARGRRRIYAAEGRDFRCNKLISARVYLLPASRHSLLALASPLFPNPLFSGTPLRHGSTRGQSGPVRRYGYNRARNGNDGGGNGSAISLRLSPPPVSPRSTLPPAAAPSVHIRSARDTSLSGVGELTARASRR